MFTGRCPVGYFDSPHCCLNHFNIFKSRDFLVPTSVGLTGLTWFNPPTRVFHVFPTHPRCPFRNPPACTKFQEILQDSLILGLRQMLGASDLSASQPGRPWGYGETCIVMSIACLLLHHQSLSEL